MMVLHGRQEVLLPRGEAEHDVQRIGGRTARHCFWQGVFRISSACYVCALGVDMGCR